MINVIIADDEKFIREGLKTIINWESYGFRILAVARDGDECYTLLTKHQPEVCIIDIRMPGKTGLEVIRDIRANGGNTHFIILSGYKDFGYVKEALTYHADNYLLKPIDEEELIDTLNKISKIILSEDSVENPLNRNRLIKQYFRSYLGLSTEPLPEIDESYLRWDSYQLLLINLPKGSITRIDEWLDRQNLGLIISDATFSTILLKKTYLRTAGISEINNLFANQLKGKYIDGCLSQSVKKLEELPDALDDVEDLLEERFFSKQLGITSKYFFPDYPERSHVNLNINHYIPIFQKLLEVGNSNQLVNLIDDLSMDMISEKYNEASIKDWFCELCTGTFTALVRDNSLQRNTLMGNSEIIMDIQSCSRLYELQERLTTIFKNCISSIDLQSPEHIVQKMKYIVEKHYMDNLKLKDMSSLLNYNSSYLGKLFTTYEGERFNVYLDRYRIERAKELLSSGEKVYSVASKVGYTYVDYFHTKFRKYVGMSPMEYKKSEH